MPSTNFKKNSAVFLNLSYRLPLWWSGLSIAIVFTMMVSLTGRTEPVSVCKKEIPRITFQNLSPPFEDYPYFQNHHVFPFEDDTSSFSLINAWWLAEAATLVYSDALYAWQRLRQAGFTQIVFFEHSGTYCFIAANNRFAIIAFRGSEIWKREEHFDAQRILADLKTNIDIRLSDWAEGEQVHSGFKAALDEIWDELRPEIEKLQARGVKIWITGHSLGAALATLSADRLPNVQGLYTFGSPRVGDKGFQANFQVDAYRVVNGKDIVARVPGEGPFRHVGELIWIRPNGSLHDQPDPKGKPDDTDCLEDAGASGDTAEKLQIDSGVFIPRSFRDHNPMLYSIYLWNALVEKRNAIGTM